jgi:hypothetical protein
MSAAEKCRLKPTIRVRALLPMRADRPARGGSDYPGEPICAKTADGVRTLPTYAEPRPYRWSRNILALNPLESLQFEESVA